MLDLFDKLISPILNYASEVWGFHPGPAIESVHLKFCKRILGVKNTTQNDFVYGELGRMPLFTGRMFNIIRYWLKIVHGEKPMYVNVCYQNALRESETHNHEMWIKQVRDLLCNNGFREVWLNQGVGDRDIFLNIFKTRLNDIYRQGWEGRLNDSTRATFYRAYKSNFELSSYMTKIPYKPHLQALSRFIMSSHQLRVESGRWERPKLPRQQRFCLKCKNRIEDEFHFIFECPLYNDLRVKLIPTYYRVRPSMYKLQEILNSSKKKHIVGVAKYIYLAFKVRTDHVTS